LCYRGLSGGKEDPDFHDPGRLLRGGGERRKNAAMGTSWGWLAGV